MIDGGNPSGSAACWTMLVGFFVVLALWLFGGAAHSESFPAPPKAWLNGEFAKCVRLRESHNGKDPAARGNIYGMLDGWAEAGGTGRAGDHSRAEQDYRAYRLYRRYGVWPWRPYDHC